MAEVRQKMRGTTVQLDAYLGPVGQIVVDIDRNDIRVHDGVTLGGHRIYNREAVRSYIGLQFSGRTLTAGNGLTGGGTLGANRTFDLGTPGTITAISENTVTPDSHTHELNITTSDLGAVPVNRNIIAGNGLTGGGLLSADRTLTLGTPSTLTRTSTNSVSDTSHSHAISLNMADIAAFLGYTPVQQGTGTGQGTNEIKIGWAGGRRLNLQVDVTNQGDTWPIHINGTANSLRDPADSFYANINARLGYTAANAATSISAGNGLTGGGSLAANRTISLGSPLSITNSTTNSIDGASHSHALGFLAAEVYTGSDNNLTDYPLGSYLLAFSNGWVHINAIIGICLASSGSNPDSRIVTVGDSTAGTQLSGTWRAKAQVSNALLVVRVA